MSLEKTKDYLRMLKLVGREEEIIPETFPVSTDEERITETEWNDLPKKMRAVIEGKKHVLSYSGNQFELKPINPEKMMDDGEKPSVNKTSDYSSDGGDAKKRNKNMDDNSTEDYTEPENLNEDDKEGVIGVKPWQRENADKILKHKRNNFELEKERDSDSWDDEERLRNKNRRDAMLKKADEILKKSRLEKETLKKDYDEFSEDYNNEDLSSSDDEFEKSQGWHDPDEEEISDEELYKFFKDNPDFPDINESLKKVYDLLKEQFENPQEFEDQEAEEYYGLDGPRDTKISIPKSLTQAINDRIKEIEASIGEYDDKGYNDGDGANSNKNKAIDALEQIKNNLSSRDYEGFREAQSFFLTLMSPITDLFPSEVVTFLKRGKNDGPNTEFGDEIEPFETSLKESYVFPIEDAFNRYFVNEILPDVVKQYGYNDKPAINQAYNDMLDSLERDDDVPSSSRKWSLPDDVIDNLENYVGTSLKESYMFSRQDAFNRYFVNEILPDVVKQYGYNDKPAINQAYNDHLDSLEKDGLLPSQSRNWSLPDDVVDNPENFVKESVKFIVEYGTDSFNEDNTAVETWFERDRQYVGLYPKDDEGKPDTNKNAIVEWWDDDVSQAVEGGFLDPRDWHGSALDYARHVGIIKEDKSSFSLKKILENKKKSKRNKKNDNPCWDGYEMVGMKKDENGNEVPNCVPKK